MSSSGLTPAGVEYAHDAALKSYDDQMRWIDALDSKAGILMAADGVIMSLLMSRESLLATAPSPVGMATATCLFISLVLALLAFSARRYEVAPDLDPLVAQMQHLDNDALKWTALEGLANAVEVNETKVATKASYLFLAAIALLAAILILAVYFIYLLI